MHCNTLPVSHALNEQTTPPVLEQMLHYIKRHTLKLEINGTKKCKLWWSQFINVDTTTILLIFVYMSGYEYLVEKTACHVLQPSS